MEIKTVKIGKLKPHPKNPRIHPESALNKLARSIEEFGWTNPILCSKDGIVLAGHARLKAAERAGIKEVPVIYLPLEGAKADAYLIADNKLQDETEWDEVKLEDLFKELSLTELDLNLTGFDEIEWDKLIGNNGNGGLTDPDAVPEEVEPICNTGDLWSLGRHRLLCGDCTVAENVEKLMGGQRCNSMVTDPPYGVDYSSKNEFLNKFDKGNRIQTAIKNDAIQDYRKFYADFLSIIPFADKNTIYIFMSGKELHQLRLAAEDAKITWSMWLVWAKNNHVLGRTDYAYKHEFIFYGWKGRHKFYGGFKTTILECDKPLKSDLHPTMKPVPLLEQLLQDGSLQNSIIYDPFGGSGSTLIACEQTNRICYMMEIDPHYCDVIVNRWQNFTGEKAELIKPA